MTNKEALEALLNGEKITTIHWLENSEITRGIKANEPKYIYFDFDKDKIVDENKRPVCFDTSNESIELEYLIHKEPTHSLLSPFEKRFIREWGRALNCSYMNMRLVIDDHNYIRLFSIASDLNFIYNLKHLTYGFNGLERNKEYTWDELDVWGDD